MQEDKHRQNSSSPSLILAIVTALKILLFLKFFFILQCYWWKVFKSAILEYHLCLIELSGKAPMEFKETWRASVYISEASPGGHTLIFDGDTTLLPTVLVGAAQLWFASPLQAQSFPVNQWCSVLPTFHLTNPPSCPKISWGKGPSCFPGVNFPSPFPPTKADCQTRWKSHGHQQPLLPTALPGRIFSTSFAL